MADIRPAWFEEPVASQEHRGDDRSGAAQPGAHRHRRELSQQAAVRRTAEDDVVNIICSRNRSTSAAFSPRARSRTWSTRTSAWWRRTARRARSARRRASNSTRLCPNFFIHEIFDEFNEPWEKEIVTNHVEVVDGYIEIPARPGPRHRPQHRRDPQTSVRAGKRLPLFKPGWEKREGR